MSLRESYPKPKKKIMFLLTQDLNSPSGLGRYFPLAKNLVRLGHSVRIIALHSDFKNIESRHQVKNGVEIKYVSQMHVRKLGSETIYFNAIELLWISLKATWNLFFEAIRHPADILIIAKPHPMNSIAAILARVFTKSKLFLDCDDYEAASNRFNKNWQKNIIGYFEDNVPRIADQITTNTYFIQERMINLGIQQNRIHYLPNGVEKERFIVPDRDERKKLISELDLKDKKVIAYIGSVNLINHPINILIDAIKIVLKKLPVVRLMIVGGGKDIELLQNLVIESNLEEEVLFLGRVAPEKVAKYYDLANITVDPVYDNDVARGRCPLKMFESWAMGKPFVTSDVGDRRKLAGIPPAAILTKPGDSNDLAKKIIDLFIDKKQEINLKKRGNLRVQQYYWSNIVQNSFLLILDD